MAVLDGRGSAAFLGRSPAFSKVQTLVAQFSRCDAPVLIEGETGTGKELAARAIHYSGTRRKGPFVPVNCGAIPESLVESEFFGNARGAFTDARNARTGLIRHAEGGTLFLDEIEGIGPRGQVALLRFLQDSEYRPVGSSESRLANVRIIAASNVELSECVGRGVFRSDLLFRLNVLVLRVPPLRARGEDVLLLADAFIERYCHRYEKVRMTLDQASAAWLRRHPWPGNVRELENLVHRSVLLNDGHVLRLHDDAPLPTISQEEALDAEPVPANFRRAKARAVAEFERAYLSRLLSQTQGNVTQAARLCGQERSHLNKLVRRHGLGRGDLAHHADTDVRALHEAKDAP